MIHFLAFNDGFLYSLGQFTDFILPFTGKLDFDRT